MVVDRIDGIGKDGYPCSSVSIRGKKEMAHPKGARTTIVLLPPRMPGVSAPLRTRWHGLCRCFHMRAPIAAMALCLASAPLAAQESLGHDGPQAQLTHAMQALAKATDDAARDSISHGIKRTLGALLGAAGGMRADLSQVPISKVDAPDGRFRLITWNVPRNDGSHRYEGFLLQVDGRRETLYELRDMTQELAEPGPLELGAERWYGALYYDVVPVKRGNKTYYTLLGWKGHSNVETRKVIDVLHFRGTKPRFGAPIFQPPPPPSNKPAAVTARSKAHRILFGYSHEATMTLRREDGDARIVFDHLSPLRPELAGQRAFYGPDLSYDAYTWRKDHWAYERDVDARMRDGVRRPWNDPRPKGERRGRQ